MEDYACLCINSAAATTSFQIRVFNGATRTIGQLTNIEPSPPPLPTAPGTQTAQK
jgi:hypothetical protein